VRHTPQRPSPARVLPRSSSTRVLPAPATAASSNDGRRGKVFSLRLLPEQRKALERYAELLRERGTLPYALRAYYGKVKLGPFLVWCALEFEKQSRSRKRGAS